jgi:hypothetical protein
MRWYPIVLILILVITAPVFASPKETEIVAEWCRDKGEVEAVLDDKTRVDCLTATHAIEADWASKWYEAVGQSLFYASKTNKRAGILLIEKHRGDRRYCKRLQKTIRYHRLPIDVWWLKREEYEGATLVNMNKSPQ